MGGLSAAIHARLNGDDVLVLEQSDDVGGKAAGIALDGYRLDPGPSIIILTQIYEKLFADAGRNIADYLAFDRLDVISRVSLEGDEPINLPAQESACLDLLRSMSPHDAASLEELLDRISAVEPLLWETVYDHPFIRPWQLLDPRLMRFGMKMKATKPFRQMVDEMFSLPLLRAFFYGFPSYGGQTYDSVSPGSFLIPYYMLRQGVFFPRGGVRAIPLALCRLAEELGVKFRFGVKVASIEVEGNRVRAMKSAEGERFEADAFAVNLDRFTFSALAGHPVTAEPSYSYFTVHVGVDRPSDHLEHHNLFIPRDFERGFEELYSQGLFPQRPIVYLNSTGRLDPDAAPPGRSNLFAVVTSPSITPVQDWTQFADSAKSRVRQVLAAFGEDWDDDRLDFERIQSPIYFQEAHGNYCGSLYGLAEKHRLWGMFPASNKDRRWRNVAFCGGSVQPGAGLPMAALSGRFAADSLAKG